MTLYESMLWIDNQLIIGKIFSAAEKTKIIKHFIDGISDENTVKRFHIGVKAPLAENGDLRQMYPLFYIPPYNDGKKYKTVISVTPQTHILSANAYELEILRIIAIVEPKNEQVYKMIRRTLERLRTTCFATDCYLGECFESSLIALRFIGAVSPDDTMWIKSLIEKAAEQLTIKKGIPALCFIIGFVYLSCQLSLPKLKFGNIKMSC